MSKAKRCKPWTKAEEKILRQMQQDGALIVDVARSMGRSIGSVNNKRFEMGITAASQPRPAPAPAVPVERPDPTNLALRRLEQELLRVKAELRDAEAKLKLERRQQQVFDELASVIGETTKPLPALSPVKVPAKRASATDVDAVLVLSDEHSDQVVSAQGTWGVEQYDFNIFRCRLERLLRLTIDYVTQHLPAHRFDRLWIPKLGDGVNGDIHGGGAKNHFRNTIKAAIALGDVEAQFVQALEPYFPGGVHVVGVSGNHPRRSIKKDYGGPHDSFDYLAGVQMATRLAGLIKAGRVSVHLPDAWTAFVNIRGRVWALNHGDDVKGTWGIPWYGYERKNSRVQAMIGQFDQTVSYFLYGHYHTAIDFKSAGAESIHSGAWPMTDPFALNALSIGQEPVQMLHVVDDRHGVILKAPIYTRSREREASYRAGEWAPKLGAEMVIDQVTPRMEGFQLINAPAA